MTKTRLLIGLVFNIFINLLIVLNITFKISSRDVDKTLVFLLLIINLLFLPLLIKLKEYEKN